MNFGVTFPMFSKIDVNGADAHPLYKYLTSEKKGLLGIEGDQVELHEVPDRQGRRGDRSLRADHQAGRSREGCRARAFRIAGRRRAEPHPAFKVARGLNASAA